MTTPIKLRRSAAMAFAPAPRAVRAGDYVFTSSIYPVDERGQAIAVDDRIGEAGPPVIAAQTRHCLETLKAVLGEHGSSLDRVLKAEVHLADAVDFYEFKLVWREYFPKDPPARTTVEIGDTLPFRGARLNLDVVALAGDSRLERQVLRDPGGPDPLDAEWASWAVRAGNLVFCSGFGVDFTTAWPRASAVPELRQRRVSQAEYFFDSLNGSSARPALSGACARGPSLRADLKTFHDVDSTWVRYMPVLPGRASTGIKGLLVPGACFVASMTVLVPDQDHGRGVARGHSTIRAAQEGQLHADAESGPWLYIAGKTAGNMETVVAAPPGLPVIPDIGAGPQRDGGPHPANRGQWLGLGHCHHVRVAH
jgi:2-iminobutanoate/2-iminopropanoate deaminase